MIPVSKGQAPAKLHDGLKHVQEYCEAYAANPDDYANGKKFEFDRNIYGHKTVRTALANAQNNKCCFCEGRFDAQAYPDVEHYRPKRCVKQDFGAQIQYPGYFWLVYRWENLYYSCRICNSKKGVYFPLVDLQTRARCHTDNLDMEEPLILDPGGPGNPRKHIQFHGEIAVGVTPAGWKTIDVVDLNRSALREDRLAHLNRLRLLFDISDKLRSIDNEESSNDDSLWKRALRELDEALLRTAQYSAMSEDFVQPASETPE